MEFKASFGRNLIVSAYRDGNRLDIVARRRVDFPAGGRLRTPRALAFRDAASGVAGLYPMEKPFAVNRRASGGTEVENRCLAMDRKGCPCAVRV